jgi:hypothetical protein
MNLANISIKELEKVLLDSEFDDEGIEDVSSYYEELFDSAPSKGKKSVGQEVRSDSEDDGEDDYQAAQDAPGSSHESSDDEANQNRLVASAADCVTHFRNISSQCCSRRCFDAFSEEEKNVIYTHITDLDAKSVSEQREALQYYLLGCLRSTDADDPEARRNRNKRARYARDKAASDPDCSPVANKLTFQYSFLGKTVCLKLAQALFGVGETAMYNAKKSIKDGITVPPTSRRGKHDRKEKEKTKFAARFINVYAEVSGLPDPSTGEAHPLIYLPAGATMKSVYQEYIKKCEQFGSDPVSYGYFTQVWNETCPHVKLRTVRTNVCDFCCSLKSKGQGTSMERLTHLAEAKEARDNFKRTILSTREENNCGTQLSFDFADTIFLPRFKDHPKQVYNMTGLKLDIFGIANNTQGIQHNFPLVEGHWPNQNSLNAIGSMLYFYLNQVLTDKKTVIHLMCGNCAGKSKTRFMMWFLSFLTIHTDIEEINVRFLIAGHTKNFCDASFGLLKRSIRDQQVLTPAECIARFEVSASCNKVADTKSVVWYDWKAFLNQYYDKKIIDIGAMHLFRFQKDTPGIVQYKMKEADTLWQHLSLFKAGVTTVPYYLRPSRMAPAAYSLESHQLAPNLTRKQYLDQMATELFVGDFEQAKHIYFG